MGLVYGKGVYTRGKFKAYVGGKPTKEYSYWKNMVQRCYDKTHIRSRPKCADYSVCEEWLDFQTFARWVETQNLFDKAQLDKDLLFPENKIYSKEVCVFIPHEINSFLTDAGAIRGAYPQGVSKGRGGKLYATIRKHGKKCFIGSYDTVNGAQQAYSTAKESHAIVLAEQYKGIVDNRVVEALYNYKVRV